jgi:dynactin 4
VNQAYNNLPPMRPTQYILTFQNPLFDNVKITLATPTIINSSRVTILCPQFDVGANGEVWAAALDTEEDGDGTSSRNREKRRTKEEREGGQSVAEAGKVWERGRNWTSVVIEVVAGNPDQPGVPASSSMASLSDVLAKSTMDGSAEIRKASKFEVTEEEKSLLEVPVFVRAEWETEVAVADDTPGATSATPATDGGIRKEKRELAYWVVLGMGRIRHIGES